ATVKAYRAERSQELAFTRDVHAMLRNVARAVTVRSAVASLTTLAFGVAWAAMLLGGAAAARSGAMTTGDVMMYVLCAGMAVSPVLELAQLGSQIGDAL